MSLDSDEDDFAEYGTPLEQFDEETVPRKKSTSVTDQIATDKYGRRRFHGAFTGGFSAGFFNSVGSLEGWTPSSFKSSRSDKNKMEKQKPEDFMDEEDMDDFGIAPKVLHATSDFNDSSLKRKKHHTFSDGPIPGEPVLRELLHPAKETVGIKLLVKMGWKPGQGIGPRVTKAEKKKMKEEYGRMKQKVYGCSLPDEIKETKQPESDGNSTDDENYENITFAPEDFQPALCKPKDNLFGLGYSGLDRRPVLSSHINLFEPTALKMKEKKKKVLITGQAFGVGAFEEEDEDIYCQEDMSQYDFSLESTSKQKSQETNSKSLQNYGEEILQGFILGLRSEVFKKHFPPPLIPHGFEPTHKSRKSRFGPEMKQSDNSKKKGLQRHTITAAERAAILEEPTVKSHSNEENTVNKVEIDVKSDPVVSKITDKLTVSTKLGFSSFRPFAADSEKEKRYEQYLELLKKGEKERLSYYQPLTMTEWERERERVEFEKAAVLYKPLSGMMSDRFVSATHPDDLNNPLASLSKPVDEEGDKITAVKMKMFGRLTREETDWRPCSLLCKRFNVPELFPGSAESSNVKSKSSKFSVFSFLDAASFNKPLSTPSETQHNQIEDENASNAETPDVIIKTEELSTEENEESSSDESTNGLMKDTNLEFPDPPAKVDLFKAIFLSSSDDDSDGDDETKPVETSEVVKNVDSETSNNLEEKSIELEEMESSLPKNIQRNLSPPRGVFASLDLDAFNSHRKTVTEKSKEADADDTVLDKESNKEQVQDPDIKDMYGPILPAFTLPATSSSTSVPVTKVLPSIVVPGNSEWIERTNKEIHRDKKHKKHKKSSKHKKSKHKKKKH
ncbi:hypothetical protein L9F63_019891 [Diploptera punctata]|uniref:G-patch domain-containing protein n=1 Tax=Diploptera punctata TaxID=6984 RepID=A0AAD8EDM0_DIPPU|nr:hypothetical protein L9F63_019891 [Diploptera punctata]